MARDTIVALSSGAVPAAIAIVRVSGPDAVAAASALAGRLPTPRAARVRTLRNPDGGDILDRAIMVHFDAPNTATGEELVEFHLHGGRAVVAAVERALLIQPGVRRAEPGEFTRRALLNGRIDLTQAEGLGDLLAAETEAQRRAALRAAEGGVRAMIEEWNRQLLALAARVEAAIDFSEEEDVAAASGEAGRFLTALRGDAGRLTDELSSALALPAAERLRDGVRVVLAGPPNSGKSTLFNRLADREAAIVSPIAGTTRDRIEAPVVIGGVAFVLTDTAGLTRDTDDAIEAIGIERAEAAMRSADIVLWLGDDRPPVLSGPAILKLHARADVDGRTVTAEPRDLSVSAMRGDGMCELIEQLVKLAGERLPAPDMLTYNQRQRELLGAAQHHLSEAIATEDLLIVAEALRGALRALDRITGRSDVEAMLDTLFAGFCIGK